MRCLKSFLWSSTKVFVIGMLLIGVYTLSVMWRVSVAEHNVLGQSLLIRAWHNEHDFNEDPVPQSLGTKTYTLNYGGVVLKIWPQKINGYQHTYGSALASYELGDFLAEKLFCANEFAEWFFDKNGISKEDVLDRRRDLANNRVGRRIGDEAHSLGLWGDDADRYMQTRVLEVMEFDQKVIVHPCSLEAQGLPAEGALGCPGLPNHNLFDVAHRWQGKLERKKHRITRRFHELLNV